MSVSEPGGELREGLENLWIDWTENDPERVMSFSDFLAPEIEATLRITFRYIIRRYRLDAGITDMQVDRLIDDWVKHFSLVIRDKRPDFRDWSP